MEALRVEGAASLVGSGGNTVFVSFRQAFPVEASQVGKALTLLVPEGTA